MFRYLSPPIGHKRPLIGGDAAICHQARILDVHINRVSSRHFLSSLIILVFPSTLGSCKFSYIVTKVMIIETPVLQECNK